MVVLAVQIYPIRLLSFQVLILRANFPQRNIFRMRLVKTGGNLWRLPSFWPLIHGGLIEGHAHFRGRVKVSLQGPVDQILGGVLLRAKASLFRLLAQVGRQVYRPTPRTDIDWQ
jgi:hypothetical protein